MFPRNSKNLNISSFSKWMIRDGKLLWLPLVIPEKLLKVTRCNESLNSLKNGNFWKISENII